MLLALFAVLAVTGRTDWQVTADKLKSAAETYTQWGITYKPELEAEFNSPATPVPAHVRLVGSMPKPNTLTLSLDTAVGESHTLPVHLFASFKLDAMHRAAEGDGALYADGTGLVGTFKFDRLTGVVFDQGFEEAFHSVGIKLGEGDAGPAVVGIKLGPLAIDVDPTLLAKKYVEAMPALAVPGGEKFGAVSIDADTDALLAAIREAASPPSGYVTQRRAVSLKALTAAPVKDLGSLTSIGGVLIDTVHNDVILVGTNDSLLPAISLERLVAIARTVYVQGRHPRVSIDPQPGDFGAPHRSKVAGIAPELEKSILVDSMLTADYAMKQLVMGAHSINGIPGMADLTEDRLSMHPERYRFEMTCTTPLPWDLARSESSGSRYYRCVVQPSIHSDTYRKLSPGAGIEPALTDPSLPEDYRPTSAARIGLAYSHRYSQIERLWPESSFGRARQNFQLTAVFTLLAKREKTAMVAALIGKLAALPVPRHDIRTSFPSLATTRPVTLGDETISVEGGIDTNITLPEPPAGAEMLTSDSIHWTAWQGMLAARQPTANEPQAMSEPEAALEDLKQAVICAEAGEWDAAGSLSRQALKLRPGWEDAEYILIRALAGAHHGGEKSEITAALKTTPNSVPLLAISGLLQIRSGQWTDGEVTSAKLISLQPKDAAGYALQAQARYRLKDDACVLDWNTAVKLAPECAEYRLGRAAAYLRQKQTAPALADIDSAIQLSPLDADLYILKGELLCTLDRAADAALTLKAAVKLKPADWIANDMLGSALFVIGKYQAAADAMSVAFLVLPRVGAPYSSALPDREARFPTTFLVPAGPLAEFIENGSLVKDGSKLTKTVLDPAILLVLGESLYHLQMFKDARHFLSTYYELDASLKVGTEARLGHDRIGDVKQLIEICDEKLQ